MFSYHLKHVTCQGVVEDRAAAMASIGVNGMLFQDDDDDDVPNTKKTYARQSFHLSSQLQMLTKNNN